MDRNLPGISGLDKRANNEEIHATSSSSLLTGTWEPDGSADSLGERLYPKQAQARHQARTEGYDVPQPTNVSVPRMDFKWAGASDGEPAVATASSPSKVGLHLLS